MEKNQQKNQQNNQQQTSNYYDIPNKKQTRKQGIEPKISQDNKIIRYSKEKLFIVVVISLIGLVVLKLVPSTQEEVQIDQEEQGEQGVSREVEGTIGNTVFSYNLNSIDLESQRGLKGDTTVTIQEVDIDDTGINKYLQIVGQALYNQQSLTVLHNDFIVTDETKQVYEMLYYDNGFIRRDIYWWQSAQREPDTVYKLTITTAYTGKPPTDIYEKEVGELVSTIGFKGV